MNATPAGLISARELADRLHAPPPTTEQAAIIEAAPVPAVVIAGAGSGKTETMAARVVWLVANQLVEPGAVLGLTFTRKAAAELGSRIRRRLAQWRRVVEYDNRDDLPRLARLLAGEPTVLTYAAYAGRLVAEHAMRVGAEPNPRLLSQAVRWQLADTVVRRFRGELPADIGSPASIPGYLLRLADSLADHLVLPQQVEAFCVELLDAWNQLPLGSGIRSETPGETGKLVTSTRHRLELMELLRDFAAAKRGGVDFGDQMTLAAKIAGRPEVARIERERYAAVLLDEFQDTGHAQVVMLAALFGGGHPVTAVGDPFQSIYGWRGASAGNIDRFAGQFPDSGLAPARVFPLATSWRNDRLLLAAANAVVAPLRSIAGSAATVELQARPGAGPGELVIARAETVQDEARWLAAQIRRVWDERGGDGSNNERTAAVLVRRRAQIPLIGNALLAAGLPVEIVGLGGLLTLPEIIDVVATLRVLAEHRSSTALMRLLTGARWRLGARDLGALNRRARTLTRLAQAGPTSDRTGSTASHLEVAQSAVSLPDVAQEPPHPDDTANLVEALDDLGEPGAYSEVGFRRLSALSVELRYLRRRLGAPLPELVAEVERTTGLDVEVAASPARAGFGRVHLDRLLDEAARFAAEADEATLGAFLAFLEAAEREEHGLELGEIVVETERVQVLTIHGAKGLEWDVVGVPGLVEDVFPARADGIDWTRTRHELPVPLRGDWIDLPVFTLTGATDRKEVRDRLIAYRGHVEQRHLAEERRLAYVAFTRARSVLLACGYVWDDTQKPREPSTFLTALVPFARTDGWTETPPPGAANPTRSQPRTASWPLDPLGERRADVVAGAELVRAALAKLTPSGAVSDDSPPVGAHRDHPRLTPQAPTRDARRDQSRNRLDPPLIGLLDDAAEARAEWQVSVDLLLAERLALARSGRIEVALPQHLAVSELVALRHDPDGLARRLRRPLPTRPAPLARRGTAFHAWLELRWSAPALLDVDELPGAADDEAEDGDVEALKAAFEGSVWAARTPAEVEVPFEMNVSGVIIRGRMDAVFGDTTRGWTVLDWKTGARPRGRDAAAAAVQLAAYRLAWARICQIPDDQLATVGAAFHYVRSNETVAPTDLLDAEGLRALVTDPPLEP